MVAACNAGLLHRAPSVSHNVVHHEVPAHYAVQAAPSYNSGHAVQSAPIHTSVIHSVPSVQAAPISHGSHGQEEDHYIGEFVSKIIILNNFQLSNFSLCVKIRFISNI